jgi:hypothetical protein
MSELRFPSLADSDNGYTWLKDGYQSPWQFPRSGDPLHDCAGWFQTYGDGMTQHSHASPIQRQDVLDYLASLAAYLVEHHDSETLECLAKDWPNPECNVGRVSVTFALSVKRKETTDKNGYSKRQYYSMDARKVSTADAKRNDRRWEEVPEYANGTAQSACRLLYKSFHSPLDSYALAVFVKDVFYDETQRIWSQPDVARHVAFVAEDADYRDAQVGNEIATAFYIVDGYAKIGRQLESLPRSWSCLHNNYCRNMLGHESLAE